MASAKISQLERHKIYERYVAEGVSFQNHKQWCEAVAEEYSVQRARIAQIVSEAHEMQLIALKQAQYSQHQKLASMSGATFAEAIKTLRRNLNAHTKKVVQDKTGQIVDVVEIPDPGAQNRAAELIIKIHDGFAPDKVDVTGLPDTSRMTNDQIEHELATLNRLLQSQATGATPGAADTPST